ncbi:zinc finger BED domain-containing protein 4-like [Mya arenaria]|uniref:zinc finger BED domain-containing protein 4-like n=1 Tax=Mya arenaria TaxID=6604 RepID=UPI0022DECF51|nr:zinc finger BED domain-containing protein 4-like [Mya arenaria]
MIKSLDPRFSIAGRTYFSTTLIPNIYDETASKVKSSLSSAQTVALTTDGWRGRANESNATITFIHITQELRLQNFVLQTRMMPESHTGVNIAEVIREAIAHPPFVAGRELSKASWGKNVKHICDVPTRWNSAADMLERYLELQPAIYATLTSNEVNPAKRSEINVLSETDTKSAQVIMKCLTPLKTMTDVISYEKMPIVSVIIPLIQQVQKVMAYNEDDGQTLRSIKEAVFGDTEKRYTSEELWHFLEECTVLDPRFKTTLAPETLGETYHRLSVLLSSGGVDVRVKVEEVDTDTDSTEKKVDLAAIFDDVVKAEKGSKSIYERVDEEIAKYKMVQPIKIKMDPLVWWKEHCFYYSLLANLVKARLCIPATSVPSEGVFRTAGDTVTAQRSCLASDLVDMLFFCKKNCQKCD